MPSSAPTTQAEFGSSDLAMLSLEFCCLSCQMSVVNVLSEYLLSCLRIFFDFHCTVRVPSFLSEDFHCTVRVPSFLSEDFHCTVRVPSFLMYLPSYINHCCQVSPNVLSKHRQSVWGSYTCQVSPNVLSKYQQSAWGSHVSSGCQVSPNVLSEYRQSAWGSYTCQVSPNVLSKYQQSAWGSYTCFLLVLDWAQLILHLSR